MKREQGSGFRVQGLDQGCHPFRTPAPTHPHTHTPTHPHTHTPTHPHAAPLNPEPRTLTPSSGSALVITLGLLAVLALLVFAFTFSARTERLAARNDRDQVTARQFVDLALVQAMDKLAVHLQMPFLHQGEWYALPSNGNPTRFDRWNDPYQDNDFLFTRNAFASRSHGNRIDSDFFDSFSSNSLPSSLWGEARSLEPHWIPIQGVDQAGTPIGTNGYIAYVVINCSGFLDAHHLTTNQIARLRQDETDIGDETAFIKDRARDTAPGSVLTTYLTLQDHARRNSGILQPVRNLFIHSYDAGPDVTVTNGNVYSDRDVQLLPKLDVNSWTNGFAGGPADLSDPTDLSDHYASPEFRVWLDDAINRFAAIGFAAPEALAWNLLNFMDTDRIPQGPEGHIAWQEPWPVEDVPLINEIALGMVPLLMNGNKPNHYAPGIELWYPFATNRITEADAAQAVVAVYTNWMPDVIGLDGNDWSEKVMFPAASYGFTFTNDIPEMAQGTDTEFLTFTLPPPYLAFPVTVTKAVRAAVGDDPPPQYMPEIGSDANRLIDYVAAEDVIPYYLTQTNLFLPLGRTTYYTYLPNNPDEPTVWVNTAITVTNTIHLLARVRLGTNWVDEASGYTPGAPGRPARTNLLSFTEPCGYEVDDPRRNGYREDWRRYLPASRAVPEWTEGAEQPVCSLNGSTNLICNPWHLPFGQGLPLVHFNQPLRRAGDIGYIQQPERFAQPLSDHTQRLTNRWQSICLADPSTLATNNGGFAFSAGSVLELFTARSANTPVRGLVHFSTTHTNVVRALMADMTVGWGANLFYLPEPGIQWMTDAYFDAQAELYRTIPIGVGDMCLGFGMASDFAAADAMNPTEDTLRWHGSLGSDTKEDLLRGLAERISFRQHIFVVVLAGRTATPSGRTSATQRAVAVVLRDAYTGRWQVVSWEWL